MGCNSSKGPSQEQGRGPRIQPPAGRPAPPAQSLIRVKLVLLGATGVGKSCLVLRYVKGLFESASRVTVGAAFLAHSVALPDGRTVKFEIWDTAGQERYASLAPLYYRGAGAAVVMYDITSPETFTKAKYWVTELQKNASGNLVICLAGNKSDLAEARQVTREEGQAYAAANSMMFLETSAKTAANVAAVFDAIAKIVAGAGAPPTGPAIPNLSNAPAPISTHPRSKNQPRSPPPKQPSKGAQQSSNAGPSSADAQAAAASTQKPRTGQAGQMPGSSAGSLPSNQSAASTTSDDQAGTDPLPPSSDAAVLDTPNLAHATLDSSPAAVDEPPSQPLSKQSPTSKPHPTITAEPDHHQSSVHGDDSAFEDALDTPQAVADAAADEGLLKDLPAAPQKAKARSQAGQEDAAAKEADAANEKVDGRSSAGATASESHSAAQAKTPAKPSAAVGDQVVEPNTGALQGSQTSTTDAGVAINAPASDGEAHDTDQELSKDHGTSSKSS